MEKVEFSFKPELSELIKLPNGKIQLFLREAITSGTRDMGEDETQEFWKADEYKLTVPYRGNLEKDVAENFGFYLNLAKEQEEAEKQRRETAEYEAEMMKNLPELLLQMNFQLMMLSSQDEEI